MGSHEAREGIYYGNDLFLSLRTNVRSLNNKDVSLRFDMTKNDSRRSLPPRRRGRNDGTNW